VSPCNRPTRYRSSSIATARQTGLDANNEARPKARARAISLIRKSAKRPACEIASVQRRRRFRQDSNDLTRRIRRDHEIATARGLERQSTGLQQIAWSLHSVSPSPASVQKFRYCWRRRRSGHLDGRCAVIGAAHFVLPFLGAGGQRSAARSQSHSPRSTYRFTARPPTQRHSCSRLDRPSAFSSTAKRPVASVVARRLVKHPSVNTVVSLVTGGVASLDSCRSLRPTFARHANFNSEPLLDMADHFGAFAPACDQP